MRFWFRANLLAVLWLSSVTPVYGSVADVIGFTPDVGQAKDVAYDPVLKRAYVASIQFGLTVVDVADPNNPVPLGAAMPSFSGSAIAYSGNYAVVTQGTLGLTVVDIANPEAPLSIATVAGTFGAVAMFGRYAYVSQTVAGNPPSTLVVTVDLLDPRNPVIVGSLNLGAIAIGNLAVQGSYLYAAAGTGGLKILSLQNPAALSVAKTLTMTESALGVAVSGSSAFVTTNAKIYVVNIQTPTSATLKGSVATAGSRITAVGNKAYAISGLQLVTIDASNQNSPTLMNSQSSFSSQGIGVASGRLLLASAEVNATTHSGGLYIYDLPADIPDLVSNVYEGFGGDSIAVSGAAALVTGGLLGARFVDVSDPFVPRIASSLAGSLGAAAIVGNIALLEETVSGNPPLTNLTVVNIGNLSAPQIVNRVPIGAYAIGNIALIPGFALVAAGSAGLLVFDISNPLIPILLRSLVLSGSAKWVTAGNDGYAYVAAGSAIEVVDIRNPAAPVSRASIPVSASALAASQGHLYAIVGLSLYAYNVTSPLSPQLDSIISDRGAQAVTTMGPLVILARPAVSHADVDQGVHVFDYTNPAAPVQIAQVIVPGSTRAVTISDGLVFAGDTASSVDVIEVNYSVPSTATPASTWTPTLTPTKSATFTPTLTPTRTPTFTPTFTATRTPTQSPTDTATAPPTATKTPTKTPTNTPSVASTATSSPTAIGGLAGAIRYQSSQKAVANASVMLLPGTSAAQTNVDGNFGFNGLPQSGWAVQPQRHDEPTCVTAGDAAQVLNAASFGTSLNAMQKLAADVTGNGTVTALDAALILERSVGNPAPFPVVDRCGSSWVFMPAAIQMPAQATATQPYFDSRTCRAGRIDYQPLQGSISGQDFVASAFGDVNGSWGGGLAFRAQTHGVRVGRPHRTGDRVRLPIYVDGIGSFRALQLRLKFNDQALQLDHIRRLGGARRALSAQRTEDGTIAFAIASSEWLDSGVVLVLELTARERLASFDFELTSAQVED